MSTSTKAVKSSNEVPLQGPSRDIWDAKYRLKDRHGKPVDQNVAATWDRVARALAAVEGKQADAWLPKFRWALENGAIPAGRIMSNAGAEAYKPAVSLINCTVSRTIRDSMHDILGSVVDAGMTLKAGCGIGYDFSTLRHKGAFVFGAGAGTNGPLAFMDIYDKMCFTVASAGGRRGAQMGTFDVGHPDVRQFIEAKREAGRLRQFNLSLLITDEFMEAVKNDSDWPLAFPLHAGEKDDVDESELIYRDWPVVEEGYTVDAEGRVACRIVEVIKARELWDTIMRSTYDYAEPGFILIDQVNRMNNNWFCEEIRATNPCGEQPLPPEGACLLGSVNLTRFVIDPFSKTPRFDWARYREVVAIFTRMLDNVVEISGLPLEGQRREIEAKRRHGMGFLGLGSTLTMLKIPYGSPESLAFTEEVSRSLAIEGWKQALELSREKGMAPALAEDYEITPKMLRERPELKKDGYEVGDKVPGRILHARYSRYMQKIAEVEPELVGQLAEHGARFTHHSSIAPTGTISLSLGNNASNGIEPSFSHRYFRNVIQAGKKTKEQVEVVSFEL
ncbi:MAG TPA: adenosylcobalamin-dependent ribonucleoside-diphosphate reductase, partial [Halomonas sp.]|nr:adenosylcobalamin-dependent ribonucleoside-diphosphate reductase [Halomonas sp.]